MNNELTVTQDWTIRGHLSTLAKAIRAKFTATAYQGDYVDTTTDTTLGDRLQVGTTATIGGVRYLLVLNVLVARGTGGVVSVRVSAWSLTDAGTLEGSWPIARTALTGVKLTPKGFVRRIGNTTTPVDMVQRVATYLNQAKANLKSEHYGRPVVQTRTDRNGDNAYDTTTQHLLPFGGYDGAMSRLMK